MATRLAVGHLVGPLALMTSSLAVPQISASGRTAATPHFRVTLIGAPHHLVRITGINRYGTLVGNSSAHVADEDSSFIYRNGNLGSLYSPIDGSTINDLFGISDAGIVADSPPPRPSDGSEAFALNATAVPRTDDQLTVPSQDDASWTDTWTNSISHNGWIAGGVDSKRSAKQAYGAAVVWQPTPSGWTGKLLAQSAYFPEATAVDAFGDAVGYSHAKEGPIPTSAIFWPQYGGRELLAGAHAKPMGITASPAATHAIDDTIVGSFELDDGNPTPCVWSVSVPPKTAEHGIRPQAVARVTSSAAVGEAEAVNGSRWMVGWLAQGNRQSATLWTNGKAYDLNALIPPHPHWTLIEATTINNKDQIGVTAQLPDGRERAVRLTPR